MKYVYPDYYNAFVCAADQCSDTCCAGWQIVVDEESLDRYLEEPGAYRDTLHQGVDWKEGVFRQDPSGRCFFLRKDLLCDMYCHLGEDSLCETCKSYPRHTEEFENVREVSLSISCPVVAKLLLEKTDPVSFVTQEDGEEEEFEDFDYFLFSTLEDTREEFLRVLQNRNLPLNNRLYYLLQETDRLQRMYEAGQMAEYESELPDLRPVSFLWNDCTASAYEQAYDRFEALYDLERLRENWQELLEEAEEILYGPGAVTYCENKKRFLAWCEKEENLFIKLEQIAVYFFFLYYPGAVYDGYPYGKVDAMVFHVANLYELMLARFIKNGETLSMEEIVDLVYRYSREIEHSDENLDACEEGEFFRAAVGQ